MALENLQSIFSQGAGNSDSQIGGRHGGLTNTFPSEPPHPDDHSILDNITVMTPTPDKPTPDTNLFGPAGDKPTPELNIFGPTGDKPTPELGTNPDNSLDSFPTPNLNIPNLPSLGNSIHRDQSTGKHVGWHSEYDLNVGSKPPSEPLENRTTQTSTITNEQLAGVSGLTKESTINPIQSTSGTNNLQSDVNPIQSTSGTNNLQSNVSPIQASSGTNNLQSNVSPIKSTSRTNNLSSGIKPIKAASGTNNLSSGIKPIESIAGKNNLSSDIKLII